MLMNDTVLAKLRASNEKAKRNRDNWKAKAEALAAERDEWKRIAEWLAMNCAAYASDSRGDKQPFDTRNAAIADATHHWLEAARETVSPANTTTKEEGL